MSKWYDPIVDLYNDTVDTVSGWFDDDTKETVSQTIGYAKTAKETVDLVKDVAGGSKEEKTGFLAPPPINLDSGGGGRYKIDKASILNALGYASEDMRVATNNVLRSDNPSVRNALAKSFSSRSMGPTLKLTPSRQIAAPSPRPRPKLKRNT